MHAVPVMAQASIQWEFRDVEGVVCGAMLACLVLAERGMHADTELEGARTAGERAAVRAFVVAHGASIALLHRCAAAEDYLEAKAHALLGIGVESSTTFYTLLRRALRAAPGALQVRTARCGGGPCDVATGAQCGYRCICWRGCWSRWWSTRRMARKGPPSGHTDAAAAPCRGSAP
jgi:hypothetical protein